LAKVASKIRVSTHGLQASEDRAVPSAILPRVDRDLYRRRQRRRALIAWSVVGLIIVGGALGAIFGGEEEGTTAIEVPSVSVFGSEMTSQQYEALHQGESEAAVLRELHNVGVQEDQVEESKLLGLFPARPDHAICSYWTLSDAPGHLVRLCFSDPAAVLLQKAVAAEGEGTPRAEETLA
jgi:hypothetical protein